MAVLAELHCTNCTADEIPFDREEISDRHCQIPDWEVVEEEGIHKLRRTFTFPDAKAARAFMRSIMTAADEQDHHPVVESEGRRVTLTWWTHKIGGLHQNDFIMAARSDEIFKEGCFEKV